MLVRIACRQTPALYRLHHPSPATRPVATGSEGLEAGDHPKDGQGIGSLITAAGLKTVSNPLEQARQCAYLLVNRLQKYPQLVVPSGCFQGNLICPYGYGVILSNITRKQFEDSDLGEVLPEHQTLCKNEMLENVDPETFQERLWGMFNVQFSRPMTLPQIDRIRWHLFPEIRINAGEQSSLFPAPKDDSENLLPDIMKVMDMQQESLARSMGEGHRVIHGVAGSGKTLILGYRCLYLAKLLHKPILVLCYNITLAARLRELMEERGINDKVCVYHFHDWCGEQLRTYHIDRPKPGDDYIQQLVETVISSVEKGVIPKGQYGAVMIDEGHDFEPEWLQLVVNIVDPETDSILLLYDDAQSIYNQKGAINFSLSSVGIQAQGRTTILKLNYRNTDEILDFAYRFASQYFKSADKDEDHVPLVEPQSAGRHGPSPFIKVLDTYEEEGRYIAYLFQQLHDERGMQWSDMCVTYYNHWMGEILHQCFTAENIPCQWLKDSQTKKAFKPSGNYVKLMTMHSSKGLEFPMVAVFGIGYMPGKHADPVTEAKLLYVAMTRATENLLLTSHRESEFLIRLRGEETAT